MPVHLPITEMIGRRAAASRSLVNADIGALLVFKKESMYYLTGYDTFGFSLSQCMILDPNGNTHLLTRLPDLMSGQVYRRYSRTPDSRLD